MLYENTLYISFSSSRLADLVENKLRREKDYENSDILKMWKKRVGGCRLHLPSPPFVTRLGIADQTWPEYFINRSMRKRHSEASRIKNGSKGQWVRPRCKGHIQRTSQLFLLRVEYRIKIILEVWLPCEVKKVQGQKKRKYKKHCISLWQILEQKHLLSQR